MTVRLHEGRGRKAGMNVGTVSEVTGPDMTGMGICLRRGLLMELRARLMIVGIAHEPFSQTCHPAETEDQKYKKSPLFQINRPAPWFPVPSSAHKADRRFPGLFAACHWQP